MVPWYVLWVAFAGILAFLLLRTLRKDRREYQRFKRYRTTARRQAMYRKWLRESFVSFGSIGVAGLVLAADRVPGFLAEVDSWGWVRAAREWATGNAGILVGAVIGVVLGLAALTIVGIVSARRHPEELISLGDIQALLPRNRDELGWTGAMSVNAGIVEELAFRLAIPAVLYGASGSAVLTIVVSLVLFGILHLYQGVVGVAGATIIGALMMTLFIASGSIVLPMLAHALIDLRSLVLIPVTVLRVHREVVRPAPVRSATRTS
jgi:membrane protease YdiL (CAAX protease family)